jgi:hemerythrin superfamily protein
MGHGGNVITELTMDHREVDELFDKIELQPVGERQRRTLADELTIELVRHSVAEEMHLYPAVREYVEGGEEIADKELSDHARVEQHLKGLEGLPADDPQFDHLVAKLKREVSEHVHDEENRLFPLLAAACPREAVDKLGEKVRTAKKTAPTRPHPASPDTPPGNKLLPRRRTRGPGTRPTHRSRQGEPATSTRPGRPLCHRQSQEHLTDAPFHWLRGWRSGVGGACEASHSEGACQPAGACSWPAEPSSVALSCAGSVLARSYRAPVVAAYSFTSEACMKSSVDPDRGTVGRTHSLRARHRLAGPLRHARGS